MTGTPKKRKATKSAARGKTKAPPAKKAKAAPAKTKKVEEEVESSADEEEEEQELYYPAGGQWIMTAPYPYDDDEEDEEEDDGENWDDDDDDDEEETEVVSREEHERLLKAAKNETKQAKAETKQANAALKRAQELIDQLEADLKKAQAKIKKQESIAVYNQKSTLVQPEDAEKEQPNWVDQKWMRKYEMLKQFKEQNGHCNVSHSNKEEQEKQFPGLACWVSMQRTYFQWLKQGKKTNLTPHRMKLLKDIGFVWQPLGFDILKFEERIPQLQAFKEKYGHTNVQQHYKDVPGLGNWVLGMRRFYRLGKLAPEKIDILESMGFQWRLRAVKVPGGRNKKKTAPTDPPAMHHQQLDPPQQYQFEPTFHPV